MNSNKKHGYRDSWREEYQKERMAQWNKVATQLDDWAGWGGYYHQRLTEVYRYLVAPGRRVLELGCGRGDLLAALEPGVGVGIDFSEDMIRRAERRHPHLRFLVADVHQIDLQQKFDVVVLSDLVNDLWDIQTVFEQVASLSTPRTRLIVNFYSRLWELPLAVAEMLGVAKPNLYRNWLTPKDVIGIFDLAGFEVIRSWQEVLWPLATPLMANFANRVLVKIWPFNWLALTNLVLARLKPRPLSLPREPVVSVIVPARNEAGNISQIFARTPEMGAGTELVFVEGHSHDDTYGEIERQMALHSHQGSRLCRQTGVGKGDAVRLGFSKATGDVLMILDADLTVPPEDLPRFYEALHSGLGEFINGVRLVYPMQCNAMRFWNLLGNKFFSLVFTWLIGQPIKDTLCGTKVFWKMDYELIAANRSYFGDFDPFGDYDLLFGAAKQQLKILDLPIRYRERTYGATNIQRWRHGWLLLRMSFYAAKRIKFV